MNQNLQNKLFAKYPKIFRQKDLSMQETCMCWGITCGDGWYDLLDRLCSQIQSHVDRRNEPQIEATQVKTKWGGLRFYTNRSNDYIDGLIAMAEEMSYKIKEETPFEKYLDKAIQNQVEEYEEEIDLYKTYGGD
jgi:hypothetical protein